MLAPDLRREARHRPTRMPAEVAALRLQHLLLRGFSAEAADKVFEAIDLPDVVAIDAKLELLRELGFGDPVKMVTSLPSILGYAIDNIRGKLQDLRELGFGDPVKMVTAQPILLSYSRERLSLAATVVATLEDCDPAMVTRLVVRPRADIDVAAAAGARTWLELLDAMKTARSVRNR